MQHFTFDPKNEHELVDLLQEGEGDYEVLNAEEQISKTSGNPMIKLTLKVWDKAGEHQNIFDYLILNPNKYSLRKIRHFCYSNGMQDFYESGKLSSADCIGKTGKCTIKTDYDAAGKYAPKSVIADYTINNNSATESAAPKKSGTEAPAFDDDIPF